MEHLLKVENLHLHITTQSPVFMLAFILAVAYPCVVQMTKDLKKKRILDYALKTLQDSQFS